MKILHQKHDEDDGAFVISQSSSQTLFHIIIPYKQIK